MKIHLNRKIVGGLFVALFTMGMGWIMWKSGARSLSQKTILLVVGDNVAESFVKATDLLYKQYPELQQQVDVIIRTRSNSLPNEPIPSADILVIKVQEKDLFNEHLEYIKKAGTLLAPTGAPSIKIALGAVSTQYTEEDYADFGLARDQTIEDYFENNNPEEFKKLLAYLLNRYGGFQHVQVEKKSTKLAHGFGVFQGGRVVKLVASWEEWLNEQKPNPQKDKVAILMYSSAAQEGILSIENAVGQALERRGAQPVYVFGYPSSKAIQSTILDSLSGKNRGIKACISWLFKFSDKKAEQVLRQLDVPVINAIDLYGNALDVWKNTKKGLTSPEIAWQLAIPELSGLVQPTVLGGVQVTGGIPYKTPIPERVERIVSRALRYVALQNTPSSKRHVALMYWNYPPGKDNIGASYLNVFGSIHQILTELKKQGYDIGQSEVPSLKTIEQQVLHHGRNVGKYAPKILEQWVAQGHVKTIPVSEYKKWFSQLPPDYQAQVIKHWGKPEQANIMAVLRNKELHFVLPIVQFGKITLMPQPDRARTQDIAALYHDQALPPHHQYLCAYLWLQRSQNALVYLGTHGTQEWLDGKETGLSGSDSPEVMAGDLPIFYLYNMDVVGEGLQAKRRGGATILDHLTPALGEAGLSPNLKVLRDLIKQWEATRALNPDGTEAILTKIEATASRLGIKKDLEKNGWKSTLTRQKQSPTHVKKMVEALQHYIEDIQAQTTPFGLHTYGISPSGQMLDNFASTMAKVNGIARKPEFMENLAKAGQEELKGLVHGLNGRYIPAQVGNDPVRNPQAIPTGKNFYTFDPRTVPLPYADSVGRILAESLIQNIKKEKGIIPKKLAFEIWSVETVRHQGMQEAQILGLLGVKIKRDKMGRTDGLELIPRGELGRPRVDVVMSTTGLYRDTFPMMMELLDQAFRLAATSPEADNPVRQHSEKLRNELIQQGMDTTQARIRSQVRIFAEPSGTYGNKISDATYASGTWDKESQLAELHINRMSHGYGGGFWGESMATEYKAALRGIQRIVHSRSSSLYRSLDSDGFFGYTGGIALGVRHVDQSKPGPDIYVADLGSPGAEKYQSLERFMGAELQSRYFNPTYIQALTQEGYSGARHVVQAIDILWGWQVVYPEVVNAEKWQEFYEIWLKDRYQLQTDSFFEKHSPHAKESITARMLEAIRKKYWQPTQEVQEDLANSHIQSVLKHGVSCGHTTCDHPELHQFIKGIAKTSGKIKPTALTAWTQTVEAATGQSLEKALASRLSEKKSWHSAAANASEKSTGPSSSQSTTKAQTPTKIPVAGYTMTEEKVVNPTESNDEKQQPQEPLGLFFTLLGIQVGCILVGGLSRLKYAKK